METLRNVLALIPARSGSKGIPGKNWRLLGRDSPVSRAYECVRHLDADIILSTDDRFIQGFTGPRVTVLKRPAALAQDDTPMIDVVKHALSEIPGPPDQIVLLLQPTQPLREPKHLKAAIELLRTSGADSVVSVVDVGVRDQVLCIVEYGSGELLPLIEYFADEGPFGLGHMPPRRQEQPRAYKPDGTCYAFYRRTVLKHGNIYGNKALPLIIPPSETQALDTPEDWREAERRLREREGV